MLIGYDVDLIREDLINYLKENNIGYRKFSKISNVNVSIISRIINGTYRPGKKVAMNIINAMGKQADKYIYEATTGYRFEDFDFEDLSIDTLTSLIYRLRTIRDEKISKEIQELKSESENLQKLIHKYEKISNEEP